MSNTQVILTTPIRRLGAEGDVVKVRPGFARNYLFPTGRALPVSKLALRRLEELKKKRAEREANELNEAQVVATKLNKLTLTFTLKTGQQDKAFGAVSNHDIVDRLKKEGFEVERRAIHLERPIKNLGKHEVEIALHTDIKATLKIEVVAETVAEAPVSEKPKKGKKPSKGEAAVEPVAEEKTEKKPKKKKEAAE